jgi:hypothetical protein
MDKIYSALVFILSTVLAAGCTAAEKTQENNAPESQPIKLTQIASYLHSEQRTLSNIHFLDDQHILIKYRNGAMLLNIPANNIVETFTHPENPHTKAIGFHIRQKGQYLFLGYSDRVDLWNLKERKIISEITDLDTAYAASISHDLKTIYAAGALWNKDNKTKLQEFTQLTKVVDADFSPDDHSLLIVVGMFGVSIYDVRTNKQSYHWKFSNGISAFQFSPDSNNVILIESGDFDNKTGHSADKLIRVYSLNTGKLLATYAHDSPITAWSPITQSPHLYTATADNQIIQWSTATHTKTQVWTTTHTPTVLTLDNKNRLWCGFENGDIKVLTENTGTLSPVAHLEGNVYSLTLNDANDLLAANIRQGTQHQIVTYQIEENQ